ncbi:MAG: protein kinase domain-containing protein [Chthoniobacterales bacterium]
MGEVYRARDTRLGRDVALKILPESFDRDPNRLRRFEQETQAVAALNHSNIVAIYDVGQHNSAPFLVSELLEGESLRAVLSRGPVPQRKVVEYAVQVANGLAAAHDKGIVHRDLKPENLFVCRDGRVKILDFGLAKLAAKVAVEPDGATMTSSQTAAGVVMGTASYMAPEQVRGDPVDPRTDMFAFGAVLFETLSGKRAFQRDTAAETMTAILRDDLPEITNVQPPIPPALDRIVRRCLEKNPEQRFQSAKDLAFGLEALSQISSSSNTAAQAAVQASDSGARAKLAWIAGGIILVAALGVAWWIGRAGGAAPPPEYQQITFRTGAVGNARFTPDGSVVYSAAWESGPDQLYIARAGDNGSTELGLKNAELLSVSKNGELAVRLNTLFQGGYARVGTLARVPLSGGTPRDVLDNVSDAEWAADGENMVVIRFVPENSHWRLEYPVGKVLLDTINWISHPRISPDGKWVAFADHENPGGDDQGSVAVIDPEGHEKKLSSGWSSVEGVEWSPSGDEVWFSASDSGALENLRSVTLSGKLRTIANVPGDMWLQDLRNGVALITTHEEREDIRGIAPGAKEERELGWLGWSGLRDISRDGTKVLFEEEAEGGGPNYTVFLRDTDGSPPVRIGEGLARAISPDNKWVITQPLKVGALFVVPTGAGQSRQLTHDNVSYRAVRYLPDGKHLLASGIEPAHGARDYLIDVTTGESKPVTPEGVSGVVLSPDGREVVATGPDGKTGVWTLGGSAMRPVPGLDSAFGVVGWSPDGKSLYVSSRQIREKGTKVFRVDIATGKMTFWKEFGTSLPVGAVKAAPPLFSSDGNAYAYTYDQVLSQAYVVKGFK